MKIRIDKDGALGIERAGEMLHQDCPFHKSARYCGDWCPLFGEPDIRGYEMGPNGPVRQTDRLDICEGRILQGQIEDQRKAPTPPNPPGG